jgi:hypothetical protein
VTHSGDIEGDLTIASANEDDAVDVDDGNVGGETEVNLGEEAVPGCPDRPFGHGPFHGMSRGFFGPGFGGMFGGRSFGLRGAWG